MLDGTADVTPARDVTFCSALTAAFLNLDLLLFVEVFFFREAILFLQHIKPGYSCVRTIIYGHLFKRPV